MNYPHPPIAREGWPFLALAVAVAALVSWYSVAWAIPLWIVALFVLQFFRDPGRVAPGDAKTVVSPADGRIVAVEKAHDPYLDRETVKVSVFMNVFNVHSNRSAVDGEVKQIWYQRGSFLNAALDKASTENERNAIWVHADAGAEIVCVQVAGLIARRILCYVKAGERLLRGQRYGFIRFGSRVDVYLPSDANIKVALGDKVYAATTVLARLE